MAKMTLSMIAISRRAKSSIRKKLEYKCKEACLLLFFFFLFVLGHLLTAECLKPDSQNVRAIVEMLRPDKTEHVSRLNGMVSYLSRFLPNLSDDMKPL